jgi:hypothetical protein
MSRMNVLAYIGIGILLVFLVSFVMISTLHPA